MISKPGVYVLDERDYHADTQISPELGRPLSSSGAKLLAREDRTPAHYAWVRDHPKTKDAWELGTVAHALAMRNPDRRIHILDARDWKSAAVRVERDTRRAAGEVVAHRGMLSAAAAMARAVRRHPTAGAIVRHPDRLVERALVWLDPETGVTCRGRADIIVPGVAVVDVKTADDASPRGFGRAAATYGYPVQAAMYVDGWHALTGEHLPFLWIVVEKDPPHLVAHYYATAVQITDGRDAYQRACTVYAACESASDWPGYDPEPQPLTMPGWA